MRRVSIIISILLIIPVIIPYGVFAQSADFEVDLLWEAIGSYTPPFYKGKALPSLEANIHAVAIPSSPSLDLMYVWEKDGQRQPGQSGRNKNSFGYVANPLEQGSSVSVTASYSSGDVTAQERINISYKNSEVLFYEHSLDFGTLFNKNIKNGHSVGESKKISLTAIPYFLSTNTLNSKDIEMIWFTNNTALPEQTIKNKISLEGQDGTIGESIISIFIKNKTKIFEEGKVGISLQF